MSRITLVSLLSLIASACGTDINDGRSGEEHQIPGESRIESRNEADGTRTTRVDATSEQEWVYLDLDAAREVEEADASWDLAFRRQNVMGNGARGVGVAWVDGAHPDPATAPNEAAFRVDPTSFDDESVASAAFQADDAWYSYDLETHTLTPRARVYYVRSGEGATFALVFLGYYDDAGTSGHPSFRWGAMSR